MMPLALYCATRKIVYAMTITAAASPRTARLPKRTSQYSGMVRTPALRSRGATKSAETSQPSQAPGHTQAKQTPAM
jgi:hypothetical protein